MKVFSFVVGMLLSVAGIYHLAIASSDTVYALSSYAWPDVKGSIVKSRIDVRNNHTLNKSHINVYYPEIEYIYSVVDKNYIGSTIGVSDYGSSERNHAEVLVSRYEIGSTVDIYYDPENPSQSLLEPGLKGFLVLRIILGIFLLAFGMFVLLFVNKRFREST